MDVHEGYMMKKIIMILVGTNVIASRPPERQPTGTPHARANIISTGSKRYRVFKTNPKTPLLPTKPFTLNLEYKNNLCSIV